MRHCFRRFYGADLVNAFFKEGPEYYARLFTDAGVQPEGHWLSMTAPMLFVGQANLEQVLSWSVPRLIPKQVRHLVLGAWRNCQPSSSNGGEADRRSGTCPSTRSSMVEYDWRERSRSLDSGRWLWLLCCEGKYVRKGCTKPCDIAIDAVTQQQHTFGSFTSRAGMQMRRFVSF